MDTVAKDKLNLVYAENRGNFLKKCPGTPGYLCCNYYVLNVQTNCNYDCQYCILQAYINNRQLTIYTNLQAAMKETERFLKAHQDKLIRIGTGELTDSLSLDHKTNISSALIPFFMKQKNAMLELKTKSSNVGNLLKIKPNENIVISWSVNPQTIVDNYEHGTAKLIDRLEAAEACGKKNYRIGFHFDPVIISPGWEEKYKNLISAIFKHVDSQMIEWISIAGFRYLPKLKNIIFGRFPETKIFLGEMVLCSDGKYRYIRPVRISAYKKIIEWIKNYGEDIPLYFCMESPSVWEDVFGALPSQIQNLKKIFKSA